MLRRVAFTFFKPNTKLACRCLFTLPYSRIKQESLALELQQATEAHAKNQEPIAHHAQFTQLCLDLPTQNTEKLQSTSKKLYFHAAQYLVSYFESFDHANVALLHKAQELLVLVTSFDKLQVAILQMRIAFLQQQVSNMHALVPIVMHELKQHVSTLSDNMTLFAMLAHLGYWQELIQVGKLISKNFQRHSKVETSKNEDNDIFDLFHDEARQNPDLVFDYSSVYSIVLDEIEDAKESALQSMTPASSIATCDYKLEHVKLLPLQVVETVQQDEHSEPIEHVQHHKVDHLIHDPSICYDEQNSNDAESEVDMSIIKWMPITHELPLLRQEGNAVMWYQINGDIPLAGICDEQLQRCILRGHVVLEQEHDEDSAVNKKILISQFEFNKQTSDQQTYHGTHTRRVDILEHNGTRITSTTLYKVIATITKL